MKIMLQRSTLQMRMQRMRAFEGEPETVGFGFYPSAHLINAFVNKDYDKYTVIMRFAMATHGDENQLMAVYSTKEQAESELKRFDEALDMGTGEFVFADDNNDENGLELTKMMDRAKSDGRIEAMDRVKQDAIRRMSEKEDKKRKIIRFILVCIIYAAVVYIATAFIKRPVTLVSTGILTGMICAGIAMSARE